MFNPDLRNVLKDHTSRYSLVTAVAKRAREISADAQENGEMTISAEGVTLPAFSEKHYRPGDRVVLCLRPQRVRYGSEPQHGLDLQGVILEKEYSGGMQHTHIQIGERLVIRVISQSSELDHYSIGDCVHVGWSIRHAPVVFDDPAGEAQ